MATEVRHISGVTTLPDLLKFISLQFSILLASNSDIPRCGKDSYLIASGSVQAVDRALLLMELLSLDPDGSRLSTLASKAALAPSTTHRLLTTLERRGFVQFNPVNSRWLIGRRAFTVGTAFTRRQGFIVASMPFLKRLRDQTRETVNVGILDGQDIVTIAQIRSREIARAMTQPGGKAPAVNSGMGKALLATWPDQEILRFLAGCRLRRVTGNSLSTVDEIMTDIALARRAGYAIDDEEYKVGMRCIAAVIWDQYQHPVAAISISALATRLPRSNFSNIASLVKETSVHLSDVIGGGNLVSCRPW